MRKRLAAVGLLGAAAGWWALRRPFRVLVEGDSMSPELEDGDQLVCVRPRTVRRGDVVVVRPPSHGFEMVKRVTGIPGDPHEGGALGPDEFLVEGDNPERSTDGRDFGPVRREDIAGVVRFRYHPRPGKV